MPLGMTSRSASIAGWRSRFRDMRLGSTRRHTETTHLASALVAGTSLLGRPRSLRSSLCSTEPRQTGTRPRSSGRPLRFSGNLQRVQRRPFQRSAGLLPVERDLASFSSLCTQRRAFGEGQRRKRAKATSPEVSDAMCPVRDRKKERRPGVQLCGEVPFRHRDRREPTRSAINGVVQHPERRKLGGCARCGLGVLSGDVGCLRATEHEPFFPWDAWQFWSVAPQGGR